ncbi:type II toxin-antitoxin system HicA family toxin [Acidithiobacillus sp. M4-SHS-6]
MKVKDLIALIEADGWQQVRQKGSHRQFPPHEAGHGHRSGQPQR